MCAMHGYSLGQAGAEGRPVGRVVCTGRLSPRGHCDKRSAGATYAGQPSLGLGSLQVTFPEDPADTPRGPATDRSGKARYHINHRGGPVKRLLDAKHEVLDTPYRYKKFSVAGAATPPEPGQPPVGNLDKLHAMLDAETAPGGDSNTLPMISPRGRANAARNSLRQQQQQQYSYQVLENPYLQMEQLKRETRERERERQRERHQDKGQSRDGSSSMSKHHVSHELLTTSSAPASTSESFLRGSAIESTDERPVRQRRQSYDARAYANKGPKRKGREKGASMEKFSSLPNISKTAHLTSTECTPCVVVEPGSGGEARPAASKLRHREAVPGAKPVKPDPSTKLPNLSSSSRSDIQAETDDVRCRMTQSEPGCLSVPYSFHGSSSKGNGKQRALSLRQMTEAFRQHMGGRYGRSGGQQDKRWVDKMSKYTSVIDNNSYDMFARKPLPKYSVSKLVLTHATQYMSVDDLSAAPAPEAEENAENPDEPDDLDLPVGYVNNYDTDCAPDENEEGPYDVESIPMPPEWIGHDMVAAGPDTFGQEGVGQDIVVDQDAQGEGATGEPSLRQASPVQDYVGHATSGHETSGHPIQAQGQGVGVIQDVENAGKSATQQVAHSQENLESGLLCEVQDDPVQADCIQAMDPRRDKMTGAAIVMDTEKPPELLSAPVHSAPHITVQHGVSCSAIQLEGPTTPHKADLPGSDRVHRSDNKPSVISDDGVEQSMCDMAADDDSVANAVDGDSVKNVIDADSVLDADETMSVSSVESIHRNRSDIIVPADVGE